MKKKRLAKKLPKGLIILVIVLFSIGVNTLITFIGFPSQSGIHKMLLGLIISWNIFKVYYLLSGIIYIIIAIGLMKRKLWSYYTFVVLTIFILLDAIVNLLMARYETLIEIGWRLHDNNMTPFYTAEWIVIIISLLMFWWFKKYRRELQ